ncbi:hypothetical protein [Carnimonas bestiolae]|uniref:hypothetical protein n=1 Tax=Carnimonas bestiolae TaxID=3402172 RepID=UPI003EDBED2B
MSNIYQISLSKELLTKLRLYIGLAHCESNDAEQPELDALLDQLNTPTRVGDTDPITIAYLALGAMGSANVSAAKTALGTGEDGFIQWVTQFADAIDAIYRQPDVKSSWSGVWAYDVVEPLGKWIVDHHDICSAFPANHPDNPALQKARELIELKSDR